MWRWLWLVVGSGLALCCNSSANADSPWYISGSVGGYFREDDSIADDYFKRIFIPGPPLVLPSSSPPAAASPPTEIIVVATPRGGPLSSQIPTLISARGTTGRSFDPGLTGNVAVGYRLNSRVRLEAELGHAGYNGSSLRPFTTDANFPTLDGRAFMRQSGADYSRFTGSLNTFYDLAPAASRFAPYIGAGIGGSANRRSFAQFLSADGARFTSYGGATPEGFALLEAGLNIAMSKHWTVVPAYRYIHYFNRGEDLAHVAKIGMRYSF